ncbi:hypothetical protein [Piscirickettsia litoralis]|uniref:Uncharacterized protein n=1 Tax=Piscirickettsia litoralis TaxID=1891921 RepID=A0ABX3A2B0_9GAMM|nr:hypothetical protein [Piscirickettsia litoralis]ODN41525.1 hypothetical protein BGC07_15570 [Piscirickettsia litoralis]
MKDVTPASYNNAVNLAIVSANRLNSVLKYLEYEDVESVKECVIELVKLIVCQLDYMPGDVTVLSYIEDNNIHKLSWFQGIIVKETE